MTKSQEHDNVVKPKLSLITLGVSDLARARDFYAALGWTYTPEDPDSSAYFFTLDGVVLGLYGWDALTKDAALPEVPQLPHFRGVTLAHNEPSEAAVDIAYELFIAAGARIVKRPTATTWGGYSGYVSDPDGHLWEIAFNPFDDWV